MKRYALTLAALALVYAASASANTRTFFGFQIGIGNAPPPPRVVFEAPPPMYYEPEYQVYVVRDGYYDDGDVFRYGPYWYVCRDDYWYRARSYRGPFFAVDVRSVPRPIFYVPEGRWHRYPPGLARWNYEQRGRGHGWGRGHGRGWEKHGHGDHGDHGDHDDQD